MTSPLLALFLRSVRQDARNRRTYWARAVLGGFVLLVLFQFAVTLDWTGAPGRDFLSSMVTLQMLAITFIGLSYFTSAIAEEKEEQMLGLLRMTDLSSVAILLGKSTSRLCGALQLLTAQIPFTIFAITLGGVSLRQVLAAYCTLAAYTFFLCNLALLGSVLARRTAGATIFCLFALALLLIAGPLLGSLLNVWSLSASLDAAGAQVAKALHEALPTVRLHEVLKTGFAGSPVGWQVAADFAAGIGCFFLAWALFGRFCDRATGDAPVLSGVEARLVGRRRSRPPRVWARALVWKDFYFLCGGRLGLALRLLGYGGAVFWVLADWHSHLSAVGSSGLTLALTTFIFTIELAIMASRIFRVELNEQTLASLATLPCGMQDVARAKSRACLYAAAPGAAALFIIQLFGIAESTAGDSRSRDFWIMLLFYNFCLWIGIFILVHVVTWLSLRMKRGALPVGYIVTFVGCMFLFGLCGMIVGAMLEPTMGQATPTASSWFANVIGFAFPMLIFAAVALAPAWGIRSVIPLELTELAAEN